MEKRGQLGIIEFQYFMAGLAIGIVIALVFLALSSRGILIPFKLPFICG